MKCSWQSDDEGKYLSTSPLPSSRASPFNFASSDMPFYTAMSPSTQRPSSVMTTNLVEYYPETPESVSSDSNPGDIPFEEPPVELHTTMPLHTKRQPRASVDDWSLDSDSEVDKPSMKKRTTSAQGVMATGDHRGTSRDAFWKDIEENMKRLRREGNSVSRGFKHELDEHNGNADRPSKVVKLSLSPKSKLRKQIVGSPSSDLGSQPTSAKGKRVPRRDGYSQTRKCIKVFRTEGRDLTETQPTPSITEHAKTARKSWRKTSVSALTETLFVKSKQKDGLLLWGDCSKQE